MGNQNYYMDFGSIIDSILEQGHWVKYNPNKRSTIFVKQSDAPKYDELDPSTGFKNPKKKSRNNKD